MSHIESVNVIITDLIALKAACTRLGVEYQENKKTYTWYGRSMGDYPMPHGLTAEDLGKCDHVVKIPGVNYEVGVLKLKKGKGYTLLYDFYGNGNGSTHDGQRLKERFGNGLTKLIDAYSVEALKRKARAKGYITSEKQIDGKIHLVVTGF